LNFKHVGILRKFQVKDFAAGHQRKRTVWIEHADFSNRKAFNRSVWQKDADFLFGKQFIIKKNNPLVRNLQTDSIFSPSMSSGSNFLPSAVLLAEKTPNQNPSFCISNLCLCTRQSILVSY